MMRRAFEIATSGRPGPVVVDVPEDVCHGMHPFDDEQFEREVAPHFEATLAGVVEPGTRSLRLRIADAGCTVEAGAAAVSFTLPRGAFATAVIREICTT